MTHDEIYNTVIQLLKEIAPDTEPGQLKPEENIRQALNIDSFDALQFIVALNTNLGIEIPEEDYEQTTTLKRLLPYLEKRSNPKSENS